VEILVIALHLIILFTLSYFLFKSASEKIKPFYWYLLGVKLLCGILYGLIYKFYFGYGDTFTYFNESIKIAGVASESFSNYCQLLFFDKLPEDLQLSFTLFNNPRAYWICKVISPLQILTLHNYWIISLYLSLFSFYGILFLAQVLLKIFPESKGWILISFFLFPSFVFWSSGLSKESLAIGALFYLIGVCLSIVHQIKIVWFHWIVFALFLWIEWKIRFFYLAVFLITIGFYTFVVFLNRKFKWSKAYKVLIGTALFLILVWGISESDFTLDFEYFPEYLQIAYQTDFDKNPANAIVYYNFQPTFKSILINSPLALFSGLFRPFLSDINSFPMAFVALENFLILLLFILKLKKIPGSSVEEKAIWAYIFLLSIFLALASPNFGSLTRYKVAFIPFLLFLLLKENSLVSRLFNLSFSKESRVFSDRSETKRPA
jgi:hypothetical protein